jgi:hypothetical protein
VDSPHNPYAALSLIVAPAILTNACSVLIMSTSNRVARTVDRARELSRELERLDSIPEGDRRLVELSKAEERSLLLLRAMRSAYLSLSGFATAALLSLLGAVVIASNQVVLTAILEWSAIAAGAVAVGSLIYASILLVRDTQIAVEVLQTRAASVRFRAGRRAEGG